MILKQFKLFIAKVLINRKKIGPVLLFSMQPFKNKPSPKPTVVTQEDLQEPTPVFSQDAVDRAATLNERIQQLRSRNSASDQQAPQVSRVENTAPEPRQQSSNSVEEDTFQSSFSSGSVEETPSMLSTSAAEEAISSLPQDLQTGESHIQAYSAVSRAIEESQAISFWDPIMGFFFGSTLAGLATIGFIIGGSLFIFRGRLNRESVSRALSFFRNNRLLTSTIFGGSTSAALINQTGTINWAEVQRRMQAFITWASAQNVSPSGGLRVPSIFKAKKKGDDDKKKNNGKEEEPDIKNPFSDA